MANHRGRLVSRDTALRISILPADFDRQGRRFALAHPGSAARGRSASSSYLGLRQPSGVPSRAVLVVAVTEVRRAAHRSSIRSVAPSTFIRMSSDRR